MKRLACMLCPAQPRLRGTGAARAFRVPLPKYESWAAYQEHFPMNVQRSREYSGRGY